MIRHLIYGCNIIFPPSLWAIASLQSRVYLLCHQSTLSQFQSVPKGNHESLVLYGVTEFKINTHASCLLSSGPPFTIYSSLWFTECMLTRMLTVQWQVGVWRGKREGRFLLMHLLCSVTPQAHTFIPSLLSVSFFLPVPRPCPVCLVSLSSVFLYFCPSRVRRTCSSHIILVTQDLTFTSLISFLFPLLSLFFFCSISWILAAAPPSQLLYSAFTPWFCSLRQESAADWGGCFESLIARSEATCLWHLSLSLSLPLTHPSLFLPLVTLLRQWESGWSCSSVPTGDQMPYNLYAAAFNIFPHYASEVAYLPLQFSLTVSELSVQLIVLLPLLHWKQSLHTLLYWHVFCSLFLSLFCLYSIALLCLNVCHVLCMLCPFEFLPEIWPHAVGFFFFKEPP